MEKQKQRIKVEVIEGERETLNLLKIKKDF